MVSRCKHDQSGGASGGISSPQHEGRFQLDDSLHVRNRFFSAADGSSFRLTQDRDATPELYAAIGRTAKISSLAHAMICGSSNLATNLLLEFCAVSNMRERFCAKRKLTGLSCGGVEDHGAHERGINNEATADGLLSLLSAIRGDFLTPESKQQVIRILFEQRFNSMIPAGLPPQPQSRTRLAKFRLRAMTLESSICPNANHTSLPF